VNDKSIPSPLLMESREREILGVVKKELERERKRVHRLYTSFLYQLWREEWSKCVEKDKLA